MINRRTFLRSALAAGGAAAVSNPLRAMTSRYQTSTGYFGVHDFIESRYNSVFIMKTNVAAKTDSADITAAALAFARSVFVPKTSGTPITWTIPIKPNLTGNKTINSSNPLYTAYNSGLITSGDIATFRMGTVTDAYFVEGVVNGLLELGVSGGQVYIREVNGSAEFEGKGYTGMATRTGINVLRDLSAKVNATTNPLDASDVQWVNTPSGLWFKNIPHLWPVGAENTWMLNIAKFKTHNMGVTLCCKNIQGSIAAPYQQHCANPNATMSMTTSDLNITPANNTLSSSTGTAIVTNYKAHKDAGVSRWDKTGTTYNSGLGMETWASRCTDNNLSIGDSIGLHIVEGIYGRDGDGFDTGPNTTTVGTQSIANTAQDSMTNIIIFGMNQVYVDIVGHYLAGHEPGNFGLFWLAKDRGLCEAINPDKIPVYEWNATTGAATLTPLSSFTRAAFKTPYLKKTSEDTYHLCTETCTYPTESPLGVDAGAVPQSFVLHQNIPNPFNPSTTIEYYLPRSGNARLEVYNMSGQLVDVLVDGYRAAGSHMAVWNTNRAASGTYFYRFRYGGFSETRKMTLLK